MHMFTYTREEYKEVYRVRFSSRDWKFTLFQAFIGMKGLLVKANASCIMLITFNYIDPLRRAFHWPPDTFFPVLLP